MPPYTTIGAVTGANKGIGLAIVRQLALQYPKSPLSTTSSKSTSPPSFLIYLLSRDASRGQSAVTALQQDPQLTSSDVLSTTEIRHHPLDISSSASIAAFANHVKNEHPEGLDFLINNAGIALDGFSSDLVAETLKSNYYGTLECVKEFLPLMKTKKKDSDSPSHPRIVNVSSMVGMLNKYSPALKSRFQDAKSVNEVSALMDEFLAAVKAEEEGGRKLEETGWPRTAYGVSKAGVTGMTKVIGKEQERDGSGVLINSCCPGYVNTDMTKGRGAKTPDEGAQIPVQLAIHDIGGVSGEFWRFGEVAEW
ncbi:carbonyl reductase [Aulographum hederae CBS 113979]|uniref:Carbonyl reductase n=1 Tax=Aulographum hederae CBS 113979 TaxID=1176131 RepID=A0A6G1GKV2_9PEZI|nr:carbonyl reductase [Aulographum hederae CBS 113979]